MVYSSFKLLLLLLLLLFTLICFVYSYKAFRNLGSLFKCIDSLVNEIP